MIIDASKLLDKSLCAPENRLAESRGPAGPFGQNEYSTAVVFFLSVVISLCHDVVLKTFYASLATRSCLFPIFRVSFYFVCLRNQDLVLPGSAVTNGRRWAMKRKSLL